MPQERENPYPDFKPEESAALRAATTREQWAARCVATRKFGGIPKATFMRGENDHSAMMQSVLELTTACYVLLDELKEMEEGGDLGPAFKDVGIELKAVLENPG